MTVDLTNTRAIAAGAMLAYANETLQAVKAFNAGEGGVDYCTYQGPCAIGVSLTPDQRYAFDGNTNGEGSRSIGVIIEVMCMAIGDEQALSELQVAHDTFSRAPDDEEAHLNFLIVTTFYAMGLHE